MGARRVYLATFFVILLIFVMPLSVSIAQEDVTPPVLVDFSFTPSTVDVTNGPATVTLMLHITDDLRGLAYGYAELWSDGGQSCISNPFTLVSGNVNDGIFQCNIKIPQYAEAGPWAVIHVEMTDGLNHTSPWTRSLTALMVQYNHPPIAADDTAITNEDTPVIINVLANDSDVDNDTLIITAVSDPPKGSATINPDKTITYIPDANANGSDSYS